MKQSPQSIPSELTTNLPGEDIPESPRDFHESILPELPIEGVPTTPSNSEESEGSCEELGAGRFADNDSPTPGILEHDGDQLNGVGRVDPEAEDLVGTFPDVWQLEGDGLGRVGEGDLEADDVDAIDEMPEGPAPLELPVLVNLPFVEVLIETLDPDDRLLVENFFDYVNRSFLAQINNPHNDRFRLTLEGFHVHLGDLGTIQRTYEVLNSANPQWVDELMVALREAVLELNFCSVLDCLSSTLAASSLLPEDNCPICLDDYWADPVITTLQCHHSHRFHRRCLMVSLLFSHPRMTIDLLTNPCVTSPSYDAALGAPRKQLSSVQGFPLKKAEKLQAACQHEVFNQLYYHYDSFYLMMLQNIIMSMILRRFHSRCQLSGSFSFDYESKL
ncbi:hypothetical protein MJO28_009594 [Puccinia striiformis f. sp. tritici]|uniref:Uncharacterized protein n=1 Tax=Puccinia striiformis f. sp. tritici TaxID=168172 RepID=A0ACC0E7J9_9BASI|nr:hypothetical protein MJO28_009594 [Puccinia striiformis f. sp. tritici]